MCFRSCAFSFSSGSFFECAFGTWMWWGRQMLRTRGTRCSHAQASSIYKRNRRKWQTNQKVFNSSVWCVTALTWVQFMSRLQSVIASGCYFHEWNSKVPQLITVIFWKTLSHWLLFVFLPFCIFPKSNTSFKQRYFRFKKGSLTCVKQQFSHLHISIWVFRQPGVIILFLSSATVFMNRSLDTVQSVRNHLSFQKRNKHPRKWCSSLLKALDNFEVCSTAKGWFRL